MKSNTSKTAIVTSLFFTFFLSSILVTVFAQSATPGVKRLANQQQRVPILISRGDTEIAKRIASLNEAITRVQTLKKLSDTQKLSIVNTYDTVLGNLNSLKTKIDADTDFATVRADVTSIFTSLRVYMLVLPQSHIIAASDRIQDVTTNMNALATKLQTRITEAQTQGKDVTTIQASFTDFNAKVVDAQTQAQNAVSRVSGLTPDQGDKTKIASNNQALQAARGEVKVGSQDLKTAYTDAKSIIVALKAMK
jgi:hypothetical protein